jgi:hypothetical protein
VKRMRKAPVEFWKPGRSDELRRAVWVYEPGWAPAVKPKKNVKASGDPQEETLFS